MLSPCTAGWCVACCIKFALIMPVFVQYKLLLECMFSSFRPISRTATATINCLWFLFNLPIYTGDHSSFGQVPRRTCGYCWCKILFYTPDVLPVTQPTVLMHCESKFMQCVIWIRLISRTQHRMNEWVLLMNCIVFVIILKHMVWSNVHNFSLLWINFCLFKIYCLIKSHASCSVLLLV